MTATATTSVELSLTRQPPKMDRECVQGGMHLIREALNKAGFQGLFAVTPQERITMRGQERIRFTIHNDHHFIVNCRPGNNGTAWEWWVRPPHPLTPEHCHRILTALQPSESEVTHTTKPRFAPEPPTIANPSNPAKNAILMAAEDHPEEDAMVRLMSRLTSAGQRAKAYKAREEVMLKCKAELDKAEETLLAAQESHDKIKEIYEAARSAHISDAKGKEAAAFMETLKGLE